MLKMSTHFERLSHDKDFAEPTIGYRAPNGTIRLLVPSMNQAFVYHAFVHMRLSAGDTVNAYNTWFRTNKMTGPIVTDLIEYIEVQQFTTYLNPVQDACAPNWTPNQAAHWNHVVRRDPQMETTVNGSKPTSSASGGFARYYVSPGPKLGEYQRRMSLQPKDKLSQAYEKLSEPDNYKSPYQGPA